MLKQAFSTKCPSSSQERHFMTQSLYNISPHYTVGPLKNIPPPQPPQKKPLLLTYVLKPSQLQQHSNHIKLLLAEFIRTVQLCYCTCSERPQGYCLECIGALFTSPVEAVSQCRKECENQSQREYKLEPVSVP